MRSHPMWVRGLKHRLIYKEHLKRVSHPMWVRGLKHQTNKRFVMEQNVAPHVGAWIETANAAMVGAKAQQVAPHVGAWIETF